MLNVPLLAWAVLTPSESRGKQIYLRGESASGQAITALLSESGVEVPATVLPCANCHARDGRGRPEGGVTPNNIRWEALTKPEGVRQEGGRRHPPYTLQTLQRAISLGVDPAGNRLHMAMPRYRMSSGDMDDLLAYLQQLGKEQDPGVSANAVRIGTLLPPAGPAEELGQAIEETLSAYVESLNAEGGVYNRQLELAIQRLPSNPSRAEETVQRFLEERQVFALAGAYMAGYEEAVAEAVQAAEVPLVGPLTADPQTGFPLNRQVFYLLSGLSEQGRAAVDFLLRRHPEDHPLGVILRASEPRLEKPAQAIQEQAEEFGWRLEIIILPSPPGQISALAEELFSEGVETVFWLGTADQARAMLPAAGQLGWRPEVVAIGSDALRGLMDAPSEFKERLFLTSPTLPTDLKSSGRELYQRLASGLHMNSSHPATRFSILAAAELLKEGLMRAGRDLSREGLVQSLEGLYQYETGLIPPLSYGPNRRIGARGAYIVSLDLEKRSLIPIGWRDLR